MIREDHSEEKCFSQDFRKCQCFLGRDVVNIRVLRNGKARAVPGTVEGQCGCSVVSKGHIKVGEQTGRSCRPVGQPEECRFYFKC